MAIEARLEQAGVSMTAARAYGTYISLDAEEVMSRFMINGFADPASFWRAISPVIKNATSEAPQGRCLRRDGGAAVGPRPDRRCGRS